MNKVITIIKSKFLWVAVLSCVVTIQPVFAEDTVGLKPEDIAKISDEAQKTLNGFEWTLEVVPSGVKKEDRKSIADTVVFKEGKMSSEGLSKKGYGTSNYTLTVGDDGIPVFETMQKDTSEGVAFWRGELVDGKIRGVISVQAPKSPATSFAFHGEKAGEAKEIPAVREEPQPEPVQTPVVAQPTEVAADASAVKADATAVVDAAAVPADAVQAAEGVVATATDASKPVEGVVAEVKETTKEVVAENVPSAPVVETPAPEVVKPEPVKPPKKKRGFFG